MIDALPLPPFVAPGPPAACPSCHTARVLATEEVVTAGGDWRCERCGEQWTASRLATVAEYEAWSRARDSDPARSAVVTAR
jgi:predicted Zn finger-like uncharacterized protein